MDWQRSHSARAGTPQVHMVAKEVVKKAMLHRKNMFEAARLPCLIILCDARVSVLRKLTCDDFGVVSTEAGVMAAKVIAINSKGGGKNGKHAVVSHVDAIAATSSIAVQVYQNLIGLRFHAIPDATALFQTHQFALLLSTSFFCLLSLTPKLTPTGLELNATD
ncbi:hypothetical protein BJ138DRAFT_844658 [Hygrophoropsis aurantiaca]|uniref:Uncharacterized protein n=1 Tax=Hygrophoropsis aurantiaca TaxID=72124 RepID=A0ACB7ZUX9_9AGAM|nr:hypothetical protein BJ138DRAFT_844658 [Hygrophoropsis aurantiaca]